MELKAKNISKKVTKPPKTVSLSISTGFPMRDSLYLVVQRSLTMSNIYLNFLQFFQSRVPLLFKSGTLLWHATLAFLTHDDHVTHICDVWWSHAALLISFQTGDDHMTYIHNIWRSHDASLTAFQTQPSKIPEWLHFSLSSSDWNGPKNGHTSWLTVWISTNIGQPCCHDYTRLCMAMQGCVKAE